VEGTEELAERQELDANSKSGVDVLDRFTGLE